MRLSHTQRSLSTMLAAFGVMLVAAMAPRALASGGTPSGTPGPCVSINVPSSSFTYNVGGDLTLKANVVNCSSDTTAPKLVVIFHDVNGAGTWCVYPESAGNPGNFDLQPGSTRSLSCTAIAGMASSSTGIPNGADAQLFTNCLSRSTHDGFAVTNLDGSRFVDPTAEGGFPNSSCALVATSNTYTVLSGINQNGIPRK